MNVFQKVRASRTIVTTINNRFLEKDKLEALLKSAQIELQNYELFKQQVDEEKLIAIQNVETNLKSHYDESIKYQLNELKSKLNAQFEQER